MSLSQTRRLALNLALFLLWPATAFAQTPTAPPQANPPQANPPQVQIQVDFVTVSAGDLDRVGIAFDRVPLADRTGQPVPDRAFLQYATGSMVTQFLQTLLHTRDKVVQAPLITTSSSIPATIQVSASVPDGKAGFLLIQTGLTITPRINSDASISLTIASQVLDAEVTTPAARPAARPPATNLRTIRSGDVLVLAGLPLGNVNPRDGRKLLVFISPISLGTDPQKTDAGNTISLDVTAGNLRAVIAMLGRQADVETSVVGTDKMFKPIYVHLDGTSVSKALRTIAASAGAQVVRNESGVYVFSPLIGTTRTPILPDSTDGTLPITGSGSSVTVTP